MVDASGKHVEVPAQPIPKVPMGEPVTLAKMDPKFKMDSRSVKTFVATVRKVTDGDTVVLDTADGFKTPKASGGVRDGLYCRIDGIDAQETAKGQQPGQPFGDFGTQTLKKLMGDGKVTVEIVTPRTTEDRNICQIKVQGNSVDLMMVREGAAEIAFGYFQTGDIPYSLADKQKLLAARDAAKREKLGIYSAGPQESPWQYRKRMEKAGLKPY